MSDLVLKLNAPPYVLLLDLFALVDDASVVVKAVASESLLRIRVQKVALLPCDVRWRVLQVAEH